MVFLVPTRGALAGGQPARVPFTDADNTFDVPAGIYCGFELAGTPIVSKEVATFFPLESNGDQTEIVTGNLVEQLTNVGTGKSITVNLSGPARVTFHADGSYTVDEKGNDLVFMAPGDNPPGPDTLLISGHAIYTFTPPTYQETVQFLSGNITDLCAALS